MKDNRNLGQSFEKLKGKIIKAKYGLTRLALTDQLVMTINDVPVLAIPDHLQEDFIHIISRSNVADEMFPENDPDDLKDVLPMYKITQEIEDQLTNKK